MRLQPVGWIPRAHKRPGEQVEKNQQLHTLSWKLDVISPFCSWTNRGLEARGDAVICVRPYGKALAQEALP